MYISLFFNFNPRSHERSDMKRYLYTRDACSNFNPRSHERSDDSCLHCYSQACKFQSTLPREERLCFMRFAISSGISIHAPTRGATASSASVSPGSNISIHAPTRGATNQLVRVVDILEISIHAPTRGATDYWLNQLYDFEFQSTLPREERHLL